MLTTWSKLEAFSGRPSRMSQLMSIPGPSLMSQLVHPSGGSVPQPQLRRRTAGSDTDALPAELLDETPQDTCRVQMPLSDLPRRAAVPARIGADGLDRPNCLLQRGEGQQALTGREMGAEHRLLRDHRLPAGQIA